MNVKQRYEGIQSILKDCGDTGCHFLTLLSIAEAESENAIDLIEAIRISMSKGWLRSDFYVKDALSILSYYTHKEWDVEEVKELPKIIRDEQYTEAIYYNKRTTFEHYRRRGFDTITNSVTVKEGIIRAYRIYTCHR